MEILRVCSHSIPIGWVLLSPPLPFSLYLSVSVSPSVSLFVSPSLFLSLSHSLPPPSLFPPFPPSLYPQSALELFKPVINKIVLSKCQHTLLLHLIQSVAFHSSQIIKEKIRNNENETFWKDIYGKGL